MADGLVALDVGVLYQTHGIWLRNWLARRTSCTQRAADLAQDTFCRLIEKKYPSAAIRDPRTYLATLARHILVDDIRRREVERAYLDAYGLLQEDANALPPDRIVEAVDLLEFLMRLLGDVPDKARRSFLMIHFDGMRYADVAVCLGISDRMVKRHVARAYAHCYSLAYAR